MTYIYPQQNLSLAVVQMSSTDNLKTNVEQVIQAVESLNEDIDLIALPEIALYCPFPQDRDKDGFAGVVLDAPEIGRLSTVATQRDAALIVGSVPLNEDIGVTNATVVFLPGEEPYVAYRKLHLFDVDIDENNSIRESDFFTEGSQPSVFEWRSWRFGLSICYDLRFSELYSFYCHQGVHALMVPAAFTVPTGKAHWHTLLHARAIESQCYVVAAAQAGTHQSRFGSRRESYGHSLVCDPWGETCGESSEKGPDVFTVTLQPEELKRAHSRIPMAKHRKPQSFWGL